MMGSTKLLSVLIVVGLMSVFVEAQVEPWSAWTAPETTEIPILTTEPPVNQTNFIIPGQRCDPQDTTPCVPNAVCRMHASSDCDRGHGHCGCSDCDRGHGHYGSSDSDRGHGHRGCSDCGKCFCLPGFFSNGTECLPQVKLNKLCNNYGYDQCDKLADNQCEDSHAVCVRWTRAVRRCKCVGPHYVDVDEICVNRAPLGGHCTDNSECSTTSAECTVMNGKSTCECKAYYYRNGNICTAKKHHHGNREFRDSGSDSTNHS